jgi:hypothetical protein
MQCYVTTDDLRTFYPRITDYLGKARVDYGWQITEAYRQVQDALRSRGFKLNQVGKPIDILRPYQSSSIVNTLTSDTLAVSGTTYKTFMQAIDGMNRMVINASTLVLNGASPETYVIKLQGSNDQNVDLNNPPQNWTDVLSIAVKNTGETTAVFTNEMIFYRLALILAGSAPNITYTAALYDTWIDRVIIHKALAMIFRDFAKQDGDLWDRRAHQEEGFASAGLESASVNVDLDQDNIPEEQERRDAGVQFSR